VQNDVPFLGRRSTRLDRFDRYFAGILGPTFPNRFYMHAAQTDRLSNTFELSSLFQRSGFAWRRGTERPLLLQRCAFLGLWG